MTARNAPPPEAPVCNYEEQMILRVPLHIADELRKMIRESDGTKTKKFDKRVAFALNSVPHGSASFAFGDKKYDATLVNLPCIVESFKTNDKALYYKSADIGQMLIVHDVEKGTGRPKKVHTDKDGTISNGVVPAFKGIKRRFRQRHPSIEAVKAAEVELLRYKGGGQTDNVDIEVVETDEVDESSQDSTTVVEKRSRSRSRAGAASKRRRAGDDTGAPKRSRKKANVTADIEMDLGVNDFAAELESEMMDATPPGNIFSHSGTPYATPTATTTTTTTTSSSGLSAPSTPFSPPMSPQPPLSSSSTFLSASTTTTPSLQPHSPLQPTTPSSGFGIGGTGAVSSPVFSPIAVAPTTTTTTTTPQPPSKLSPLAANIKSPPQFALPLSPPPVAASAPIAPHTSQPTYAQPAPSSATVTPIARPHVQSVLSPRQAAAEQPAALRATAAVTPQALLQQPQPQLVPTPTPTPRTQQQKPTVSPPSSQQLPSQAATAQSQPATPAASQPTTPMPRSAVTTTTTMMASAVAPPPSIASSFDYLNNAEYIELAKQEGNTNRSIKALSNELEENKTQMNRAPNHIIKKRFEDKVKLLQDQLAAKQKALAEIQAKMEAIRNGSRK